MLRRFAISLISGLALLFAVACGGDAPTADAPPPTECSWCPADKTDGTQEHESVLPSDIAEMVTALRSGSGLTEIAEWIVLADIQTTCLALADPDDTRSNAATAAEVGRERAVALQVADIEGDGQKYASVIEAGAAAICGKDSVAS